MSGAVQRRRGGPTSKSSGSENKNSGPKSHEDRDDHKLAYDPQEVALNLGNKEKPVLTLMEELILLGLKDEEGLLSFWNDSLSYVLRGCIMLELALQGKIAVVNDPARRHYPLLERFITVTDDKLTGEVLLDETISLMKTSEPMSVLAWMEALSGETWNLSKIGYQLKQVRDRLTKGLVDKKICRTDKKSFFIFDMATHPVVDHSAKANIVSRLSSLLDAPTFTPDIPSTKFFPSTIPMRCLRTVALAISAYAGNVLENLYNDSSFEIKDSAFAKVEELSAQFVEFPFTAKNSSPWANSVFQSVMSEIPDQNSLQTRLEVVAAVFQAYSQVDSLV